MIAAATILFFGTMGVDLLTDYRLFLKGKTVKHGVQAVLLRSVGLIPAGAAFCLTKHFQPIWGVVIPAAFMVAFWYWLVFNGLWGLLKERNWAYLGESAGLDRFEKAHSWVTPVKWAVCAASFTTYVILYPT